MNGYLKLSKYIGFAFTLIAFSSPFIPNISTEQRIIVSLSSFLAVSIVLSISQWLKYRKLDKQYKEECAKRKEIEEKHDALSIQFDKRGRMLEGHEWAKKQIIANLIAQNANKKTKLEAILKSILLTFEATQQ